MSKTQAPAPAEKAKADPQESIPQELANWLRDFRQNSEKGLPFLAAFLVMRSKEAGNLFKLMKGRFDTTQDWAIKRLSALFDDSRDQFDLALSKAFQAVMLIVACGLGCLAAAAFVPTLPMRSIIIPPAAAFVSLFTIWILKQIVPLFLSLGIIMGWVRKGAEQEFSWASLLSLPQTFFGGITAGVNDGLHQAKEMWYRLGKIPYWFAAGALYLTLPPLHKAPFLIPIAALTIPIFFFGNVAFKKEDRFPVWTFINWGCAFLLLDVWLYSQWAEYFQPVLMHPASTQDRAIGLLLVLIAAAQLGLSGMIALRKRTALVPKADGSGNNMLPGPHIAGSKNNAKRVSWIGSIVIALIFVWAYHLTVDGQPHVKKIGPGYYRIAISSNAGWRPTAMFWPGDQVFIAVEQPRFALVTTDGQRISKSVEGKPFNGRLGTPRDLALPNQSWRYIDQDQPVDGLLLRYGDDGPVVFCGQGLNYTCPMSSRPRPIYTTINLGLTNVQSHKMEGTVVFTIKVVHSDHPIK